MDHQQQLMAATHLIFDCDGVLVDSEKIAVSVEAAHLGRAGFAVTAEEVCARFVGLSSASVAAELEAQFGRRLPDGLMAEVQRETLERFPDELTSVPGIEAVLDASGLPRCVASSSNLDRIRMSLAITGLEPKFDPERIFSAQMVENGKPAPDLFLFAAEKMHADPKRCVVIEDSPHGVVAGVAAGMTVIGLGAGGHAGPTYGDRLRDAGAAFVAETTAELGELLAETQH